jgi:hypothetical protein
MADEAGDPVLKAARRVRAAEDAFLAIAGNSESEFSAAALDAEARWRAADEAFADALPTSRAGASLKLAALVELLHGAGADDASLELRHLRALQAYIAAGEEAAADAPSSPVQS